MIISKRIGLLLFLKLVIHNIELEILLTIIAIWIRILKNRQDLCLLTI